MTQYRFTALSVVWIVLCACASEDSTDGRGKGTVDEAGGGGAGNETSGTGATGTNDGGTGAASSGGNGQVPPDLTVVCEAPADAAGFTFQRIAVWRDDAKAAYTIFHDDLCDYGNRGIQENAVPALSAHGLAAGLGAIGEECQSGSNWDMVRQVEAAGNEIMNHSLSHLQVSTENAAEQVALAKTIFDAQIVNPISYFIFPYDYFTPATIAAVQASGHIGARGGNRDDNDGMKNPPLNLQTPTNDMEVEFDVWPRTYSKYARYKSPDFLNVHVYNAIERGLWATREFHSVIQDDTAPEGQGFGPIKLSEYNAHLDFLVDAWKSNQVWTAPPSAVIRYRRARSACTASVSGNTLGYGTSSADCTAYATPISVIVSTGKDVASVQAMQGDAYVASRKIGPNTFSITADPTKGSVELSGCAEAGPTVDASITLPPKPEPAASVCELETVVGNGSNGAMDNLEFSDPSEFQSLPNLRQADGRNGSWSWYPMNISVAVEPDPANPSNHALHYVAGNLGTNVYSGVTLAFLGGNGAGSCYDASAYTGVRFKIKGTATDDDKGWGSLNHVSICLVTAATQTTAFGGDAPQEMGHFCTSVNIASAATTFMTAEVPFSSLRQPWNCANVASCPASFPKGELQAIDWGLMSGQSLNIWLDDIELY